MTYDTILNVRVTPELLDELYRITRARRCNLSEAARVCLTYGIAAHALSYSTGITFAEASLLVATGEATGRPTTVPERGNQS